MKTQLRNPLAPTLKDRVRRLMDVTWMARAALAELAGADLDPGKQHTIKVLREALSEAHGEAYWISQWPNEVLEVEAPDDDDIDAEKRDAFVRGRLRASLHGLKLTKAGAR